jgi:hypothetical protein
MKRFTLTLLILCAAGTLAYAGTEKYSSKDKEVMQQAPPPCDWYRAHEWDFSFWGTFAFSGNPGLINDFRTGDFDGSGIDGLGTEHIDIGAARHDRFLNKDNALGGGLDVKYFFNKWMAIGAEGFIVDADFNSAGAGLGTFTFRYPIGCSRFAPYVWGGFGAAGGGSHTVRFFNELNRANGREPEFRADQRIGNKHAEATGQVGAGFEIRITHHIGVMTDFAWNVLSGPQNDFGMARAGVTLSY